MYYYYFFLSGAACGEIERQSPLCPIQYQHSCPSVRGEWIPAATATGGSSQEEWEDIHCVRWCGLKGRRGARGEKGRRICFSFLFCFFFLLSFTCVRLRVVSACFGLPSLMSPLARISFFGTTAAAPAALLRLCGFPICCAVAMAA